MKTLRFYNRVIGWGIFALSALVYMLTMEPTASLWDCGEFIASAYKLQVMHQPGAPIFMIIGRFFTLFAFGDVTKVALMVNIFSVLASAFTILFLFWTITHLAVKLLNPGDNPKPWQMVAILGSSVVGALAYTFSDTFWFSAVEGEVYASSSFFTAIVFWAILKWENVANEKYANRWLILIAYLMGLSIGVHLLNLLAIPAIGMVYYFKKYTYSRKGMIWALVISTAILGATLLIIPGVAWLGGKFELLFVNSFGLPYNTGLLFFVALVIGGVIYGIWYTQKNKMVLANTSLLALAVILIGYSSYTMIMLRSRANTPIDMTNPDNVFSLHSYLQREQYGDNPLIKGAYFNNRIIGYDTAKVKYSQIDGRYVATDYNVDYKYYNKEVLFPRMWNRSSEQTGQNGCIEGYIKWADLDADDLYYTAKDSRTKQEVHVFDNEHIKLDYKISYGANLKYLFRYQLGHMYFRYFMWNFSGRQNDEQGHGGPLKGNWITGISFVDNILTGTDESKLSEARKDHPGRNTYYMLPLILGILGIYYQASRHKKDFSVVAMLFFMTGIAIVLYLNQPPDQPRERDYAYAGSFYAFAIWIGLGVIGIIKLIGEKAEKLPAAIGIAGVCLLLVPGIMARENWDDHDRSGRYMASETAKNYLRTCKPNAILFTAGDNDTYPVWYAQQVEGFRTDVRVVNTALLQASDYIDQLRQQVYKSRPLPIRIDSSDYIGNKMGWTKVMHDKYFDLGHPARERWDNYLDTATDEALYFWMIYYNKVQQGDSLVDRTNYRELKTLFDFMLSDNDLDKWNFQIEGSLVNFIPSRNFMVSVNYENAKKNVHPDDTLRIQDYITGRISGEDLNRSDLMVLNIIANNDWERPLYFTDTRPLEKFGLEKYIQQTGLAYQLAPFETGSMIDTVTGDRMYVVDVETMYVNLMDTFTYKNAGNPKVFMDVFHRDNLFRQVVLPFNELADALIKKGDLERAEKVLDKCTEVSNLKRAYLYSDSRRYYYTSGIIENYMMINPEKAVRLAETILPLMDADYVYINTLKDPEKSVPNELFLLIRAFGSIHDICQRYDLAINRDNEEKLVDRLFSAACPNMYSALVLSRSRPATNGVQTGQPAMETSSGPAAFANDSGLPPNSQVP